MTCYLCITQNIIFSLSLAILYVGHKLRMNQHMKSHFCGRMTIGNNYKKRYIWRLHINQPILS